MYLPVKGVLTLDVSIRLEMGWSGQGRELVGHMGALILESTLPVGPATSQLVGLA